MRRDVLSDAPHDNRERLWGLVSEAEEIGLDYY